MPAGGRALIPKTLLGGLPFVGFYTSAPSRCIRGMNGGAVLLSFFLISIFLFSKLREADGHALISKNALGRSPLHFLISIFYFLSLQSFRRARDVRRQSLRPEIATAFNHPSLHSLPVQ